MLIYFRYYAKRCFLSLIENLAKHMITVKDSVIQECIQFLEHCEGKSNNVLNYTHAGQPLPKCRTYTVPRVPSSMVGHILQREHI